MHVGIGRIKPGAVVFCDMQMWEWPDMPHGQIGLSFEVTDTGSRNAPLKCVAPQFGKPSQYGNGAVCCGYDDIEWVTEPAPPFIGMGI